jgi:hypothetical protein
LSRPDNWTISIQQLAQQFRCGRDKIQRAMNELRDAGHAKLRSIHEAGRLRGKRWEVSEDRDGASQDNHISAAQAEFREPENRAVCEPSEGLEFRQTENRPVKGLNNEYNKIPPKAPQGAEPADAGPTFDEFEAVYPFGDADPCGALRYFRNLSPEERRKAVAHAVSYVADRKARGLRPATPQTYLRSRLWEAQKAVRGGGSGQAVTKGPSPRPPAGASTSPSSGVYARPDGKWFLRPDTKNHAAWRDYERRSGITNTSLFRPSPWPPGHEGDRQHRAA